MGLSCGMTLVKYGIFVFNLLLVIAGLAFIVIGSLAIVNFDVFHLESINSPIVIPILLVVLGCVVFLVSFFGCCGALRESKCMILTYTTFLTTLIILTIVVFYLAFVGKEELSTQLQLAYKIVFDGRHEPISENTLDQIQKLMLCCGKENYEDFLQAGDPELPKSCCKDSYNCTPESAYTLGCFQALDDFVKYSLITTVNFAGGFFVFLFVGLVFGCCLAYSISRH